jgi:protein-L-isoaspartate O-methyltransferase
MATLSASTIASYSPQPPSGVEVEVAQAAHRIRLAENWGIKPGNRVVEIGCGQGNTTAVLAEIVGPTGKMQVIPTGLGETY